MSEPLEVETGDMFAKAHSIGNHAEELRDELTRLVSDWDNLSRTWEGRAAKAYQPVWERWHENAAVVVEILADSAQKLAAAVVAYEDQDAKSASGIDAAGGGVL